MNEGEIFMEKGIIERLLKEKFTEIPELIICGDERRYVFDSHEIIFEDVVPNILLNYTLINEIILEEINKNIEILKEIENTYNMITGKNLMEKLMQVSEHLKEQGYTVNEDHCHGIIEVKFDIGKRKDFGTFVIKIEELPEIGKNEVMGTEQKKKIIKKIKEIL